MQPVMAGSPTHRSDCPINLTLEILGDRWSLLLRDMMFGGRRHLGEVGDGRAVQAELQAAYEAVVARGLG